MNSLRLVCCRLSWLAALAAGLAGCASKAPAPVVERAAPAPEPVAAKAAPAGSAPAPALVPGKDGYVVKKGDTVYGIALNHGLDYKELSAWNHLDNPNVIAVGQLLRITPPADAATAQTAPVQTAIVKPVGVAPALEARPLEANSETLKKTPKAGKEPYSDEAFARAQQAGEPPKAEAKPEAKVEPKPEPRPDAKTDAKPLDAADEVAWAWPVGGKLLAGFNEATNKGVDIAGKAGDPVLAAGDGKVVYSGTGLRGYGQLVIIKHNSAFLSAYAHNSKVLVKEGQAVTRGQKIAEMGNTDADQVKLHFEVRRQGKPVDPMKYLPAR
jgi:lipoprotein NlpD